MTATLTEAAKAMRSLLAPFSPRHRRWQHFLHSLPLDPDQLPRPLAAPGANDFIICGSPRTGTTLLSAVLFQPPTVVTVMEPWDGMRMPPAQLFASLRQEILDTGNLRRGKLDMQMLLAAGSVKWHQEGASNLHFDVEKDFRLGVKWPAFWRYLELLPETKFLVCLRHPVETIHSFKEVGGRLAQGLEYDTKFNHLMNEELKAAKGGNEIRRILLYDYINLRIVPFLQHDNVFVVRYERWFTEPKRLLAELCRFLGVSLTMEHVKIRQPRGLSSMTTEEEALIRTYCQSAQPLGYSL
jgi:hypothetical protein